jgi:hypothetical protein
MKSSRQACSTTKPACRFVLPGLSLSRRWQQTRVSPGVMRRVGHHFFSVRRHVDPVLNGFAVQFIERI